MASPALQQAYVQQLAYQRYLQQQSLQLQAARTQLALERAKLQAEKAEAKETARAELHDKIRESKLARRQAMRTILIAKRETRERNHEMQGNVRTELSMNR